MAWPDPVVYARLHVWSIARSDALPENKILNSIDFEKADLAFLYMGNVFNTSAPGYA